jgi:hypothetical protein
MTAQETSVQMETHAQDRCPNEGMTNVSGTSEENQEDTAVQEATLEMAKFLLSQSYHDLLSLLLHTLHPKRTSVIGDGTWAGTLPLIKDATREDFRE